MKKKIAECVTRSAIYQQVKADHQKLVGELQPLILQG
jgi:hypothetical protein